MEIIFYLTNNCNMNCNYCYQGEKKGTVLTFEIAKKCIDYYSQKHKNISLGFFGGEPLLHIELMKSILDYCKDVSKKTKCKFIYSITTNGTLINDVFIDLCKKYKIKVGISIDGKELSHNLNRKLLNGTGSFTKTLEGTERILKSKIRTMALPVICLNNVQYLSDNVEYLLKLGFSEITLNFNYFDNWNDDSIAVLREQYKKVEELFNKYNKLFKPIHIFPIETKMIYIINQNMKCGDLCNSNRLCVNSDGTYYPCIQFVGKEEYSIGNYLVGEDTQKRGQLIKRRMDSDVPCKECAYNKFCAYSCGCVRMCATGGITLISPLVCETEKIYIESAINLLKKKEKNNEN